MAYWKVLGVVREKHEGCLPICAVMKLERKIHIKFLCRIQKPAIDTIFYVFVFCLSE